MHAMCAPDRWHDGLGLASACDLNHAVRQQQHRTACMHMMGWDHS